MEVFVYMLSVCLRGVFRFVIAPGVVLYCVCYLMCFTGVCCVFDVLLTCGLYCADCRVVYCVCCVVYCIFLLTVGAVASDYGVFALLLRFSYVHPQCVLMCCVCVAVC